VVELRPTTSFLSVQPTRFIGLVASRWHKPFNFSLLPIQADENRAAQMLSQAYRDQYGASSACR
jgi:hypothetical protein